MNGTGLISNSVGRKLILALTGLMLVGFVIVHLAGNLTLLIPGGELFNQYAETLHRTGKFLLLAEVALLAAVLIHFGLALSLKRDHAKARPEPYAMERSKGGPSRNTVASRSMIVSGIVLLAFLILHVWQFRFGPGIDQGYSATIDGRPMRDLYRLVVETFKNPLYVAVYVGSMLFLGLHLRHGIWSGLQSIGALSGRISLLVHVGALVISGLLMIGFLILPLWVYFFV